ncbi:MAG: hypothetical protein RIT04_279 [Candidatus Parcubacteria bacterium]|jgi:hypothetical protein
MTAVDLVMNPNRPLLEAFLANNFLKFRINPRLLDESKFPRNPELKVDRLMAHFFQSPAGCMLDELPKEMAEQMMIRPPDDIREVIALGKILKNNCDYWIYAPKITGSTDLFLRIMRHDEWAGYGMTISRLLDAEKNLWDLDQIGFSNTGTGA